MVKCWETRTVLVKIWWWKLLLKASKKIYVLETKNNYANKRAGNFAGNFLFFVMCSSIFFRSSGSAAALQSLGNQLTSCCFFRSKLVDTEEMQILTWVTTWVVWCEKSGVLYSQRNRWWQGNSCSKKCEQICTRKTHSWSAMIELKLWERNAENEKEAKSEIDGAIYRKEKTPKKTETEGRAKKRGKVFCVLFVVASAKPEWCCCRFNRACLHTWGILVVVFRFINHGLYHQFDNSVADNPLRYDLYGDSEVPQRFYVT